ncbi:MAG: hypothetical protein ACXAC7_13980 [Candidatus Hodarchaeales archaeon]|jgi:hypothetical protein
MKSQFKTAMFLAFGFMFLLLGLYFGELDIIIDFMSQVSDGGTYKYPH